MQLSINNANNKVTHHKHHPWKKIKHIAHDVFDTSDYVEIKGDYNTQPKPKKPLELKETQTLKETQALDEIKKKADVEDFKKIAQAGDVILCNNMEGNPTFKVVEWVAFGSPWSHVAAYVGDGIIMHADINGVVKESAEDFFKDYKITLFRPKYKSDQARDKAINYIKSHLGERFDLKFDIKSDNELYCAEVVYKGILESFNDSAESLDKPNPLEGEKYDYSYLKATKELVKELIKGIRKKDQEELKVYLGEMKTKLKDNAEVVDEIPFEPMLRKNFLTPMSFRYSPLFKQVDVPDEKNYYWSLTKKDLKTPKKIKVLQHILQRDHYIERVSQQWLGSTEKVVDYVLDKLQKKETNTAANTTK